MDNINQFIMLIQATRFFSDVDKKITMKMKIRCNSCLVLQWGCGFPFPFAHSWCVDLCFQVMCIWYVLEQIISKTSVFTLIFCLCFAILFSYIDGFTSSFASIVSENWRMVSDNTISATAKLKIHYTPHCSSYGEKMYREPVMAKYLSKFINTGV